MLQGHAHSQIYSLRIQGTRSHLNLNQDISKQSFFLPFVTSSSFYFSLLPPVFCARLLPYRIHHSPNLHAVEKTSYINDISYHSSSSGFLLHIVQLPPTQCLSITDSLGTYIHIYTMIHTYISSPPFLAARAAAPPPLKLRSTYNPEIADPC
ncbi:hypothetical protein M430DRAFT_236723 [Amorphotheca resinae ATCC 22711]|uniref:Uncharacterized protein n=1 Tax=Amorphotheca resinae ATCC 22711 TaxID=857342 RepID=A0A2T3B4U1_AMORE|nr:hypothetical protein M430DRAFT_236723 [Amorphotheca resinae ATCC 22711]PSS20656.1 hypothetical protein M430DRAFT_236723 [Amorphotheca resinae ATCC 22711]